MSKGTAKHPGHRRQPNSRAKAEKSLPFQGSPAEYRFDRVSKEEWVECANWEFHREICRRDGEAVPKPWLEMTSMERRTSAKVSQPRMFSEQAAIELPAPLIYGARSIDDDGQSLSSAEVVELEMLVRWDNSDEKLIKDMVRVLKDWLREQRRSNPSAHVFNPGKPRRGKRPEPLTFLIRLAAWRLSTHANLPAAEIEDLLRPLLKAAGQSGLSGNLARLCRTIDNLLRK